MNGIQINFISMDNHNQNVERQEEEEINGWIKTKVLDLILRCED